MEQQLAVSATVLGVLALAVVFLWVASATGRHGNEQATMEAASRSRTRVFWVLAIVSAVLIALSLNFLPYPLAANASPQATVVQVMGYQWRWEISQTELPVGQPVEFHVGAADVNHGFAIYDSSLNVQAQVQAMPGFTNVLRHTFSQPGVYKLLCLEYCGLAHHGMVAELTVR